MAIQEQVKQCQPLLEFEDSRIELDFFMNRLKGYADEAKTPETRRKLIVASEKVKFILQTFQDNSDIANVLRQFIDE